MNAQKVLYSPSYKNIKIKASPSPKDLKEKIRKDYRHKIQNCRDILLRRFRNSSEENVIRQTLTDIYNKTFNFTDTAANRDHLDEEETVLEEIKQEIIQEEIDWWQQEYEKSQFIDIDWTMLDQENSLICPICQKNNLSVNNSLVSCLYCNFKIKTTQSLVDIKKYIFECIEKHSSTGCNADVNFTITPEMNDEHIFLICEKCNDMQLIV